MSVHRRTWRTRVDAALNYCTGDQTRIAQTSLVYLIKEEFKARVGDVTHQTDGIASKEAFHATLTEHSAKTGDDCVRIFCLAQRHASFHDLQIRQHKRLLLRAKI